MPADTTHHLYWSGEGEAFAATSKGLYAFVEPFKEIEPEMIAPDSLDFRSVFRMSDSTLVAGTETGTLYIQPDGQDWDSVFVDTSPVVALTESASGAWFAGTSHGVFRSENKGASWDHASLRDPIKSLHQHPHQDVLFALTVAGRFYRSFDDGVSWVYSPWVNSDIRYLHTTPNGTLLAGVYSSISPHGLQAYNPETETWTKLGFTEGKIKVVTSAPDGTLFVKFCPGVIGHIQLRFGKQSTDFTDCAFYQSLDDGVTWEKKFEFEGVDGYTYDYIRLTALDQNTLLLILREEEDDRESLVMRSTDGGATWEEQGDLRSMKAQSFLRNPDGSVYLYTQRGPRLLQSTDAGATWRQIRQTTSQQGYLDKLARTDDGTLVAVFGHSSVDRVNIFRSLDNGVSWQQSQLPDSILTRSARIWQLFTHDNTVYARLSDRLLVSQDAGITWEDRHELLEREFFQHRAMATDNQGQLYGGQHKRGLPIG